MPTASFPARQTPSAFAPRARHLSAVPADIPRVVAIGGGTGLPSVLEGLCALAEAGGATGRDYVSAVVTVNNDGGSSGRR